jgi:hypothetical protein
MTVVSICVHPRKKSSDRKRDSIDGGWQQKLPLHYKGIELACRYVMTWR